MDEDDVESAVSAYDAARTRADAARDVERAVPHETIAAARRSGMSLRETAEALGVPRMTVARAELRKRPVLPSWATTPHAWVEAWNAAWAHDPSCERADAPFEVTWHGSNGLRSVRFR